MVDAMVLAMSVGCSIVVLLTLRWLVAAGQGFQLMRLIIFQIFFIGVWLLS